MSNLFISFVKISDSAQGGARRQTPPFSGASGFISKGDGLNTKLAVGASATSAGDRPQVPAGYDRIIVNAFLVDAVVSVGKSPTAANPGGSPGQGVLVPSGEFRVFNVDPGDLISTVALSL